MQTSPTIFKRTSSGKVQIWYAEHEDGKYRTVSGQKHGKKTTADWTVCEAKNVGRSNETSPEQQAALEVKALYTKKLKLDYHEREKDIDIPKYLAPMLAKKYEGIKWDEHKAVFSQPKLDGIRCIATRKGLFTRKGEPIISCPHIEEAFRHLLSRQHDGVKLDGELYRHGVDLQTIASCVRKQKPTGEDFARSEELIQYHVYDVPSLDSDFSSRASAYDGMINYSFTGDAEVYKDYIIPVRTIECKDQESLDAEHRHVIEENYEGQIVRLEAPYENKRSKNLLKRKIFINEEFIVVDFEEGKGNWAGKAKKVYLENPYAEGTFKAGIKGTMEYCADLLANKDEYVGIPATVKYIELTPDNVPFHGVMIDIGRTDV